MGRFGEFTDAEITALWDGLTLDDGIRFDPRLEGGDPVESILCHELFAEAQTRALTLAVAEDP
jgi:hypothetical protein